MQLRLLSALMLLLLGVAVVVCYAPGLNGPWVFDDDANIVRNTAIQIDSLDYQTLRTALFPASSTLPTRPLSQLTIALNHYYAHGTADTFPYKITNLVIHLFNALLVYWLATLLLNRAAQQLPPSKPAPRWLPTLIAFAWALHPLHLTSVLYVVQRMTSLSALFVLAGLIVFIYGRERVERHRRHGFALMGSGLIAGTVLGFACKENAVLLLPLALVVDQIFYDATPRSSHTHRKLNWLYAGLIVLGSLAAFYMWAGRPDIVSASYVNREFTLLQRLLTEPRVLLFYLSLVVFPSPHRFSLYHDDIELSVGLFDPWTTLPAMITVVALIAAAVFFRRRYPMFGVAVLWYAVGHSLESSVIGLELVHEHRNYLPDVGLFIGALYGLFLALRRTNTVVRRVVFAVLILSFGVATHARAQLWASDEAIIEAMARDHPRSARSHAMLATLYAERKGDLISAVDHYSRAAALAPYDTSHVINLAVMVAANSHRPIACPNKPISSKPDTETGSSEKNRAAAIRPDPVERPQTPLGPSPMTAGDIATYVAERLADGALPENTLYTLTNLSPCLATTSRRCALPYCVLRGWYLAALRNRRMTEPWRENVTTHLFNNAVDRSDFTAALEAARASVATDDTKPVYRLMELNAHVLLGDTEQAKAILGQLRAMSEGFDEETSKNMEILERQIAKRQTAQEVGDRRFFPANKPPTR